MIDWVLATLGTQAVSHTVAASVGPQIQDIIRPHYQNICKKLGKDMPQAVNHDLQRLLGIVYVDCGKDWLESLPEIPEHEDRNGSHKQFKELCGLQLKDFKERLSKRDHKPSDSSEKEKQALELLLNAIPEVQLDDFGYENVTANLTAGFVGLIERLIGGEKQGVPFPSRFRKILEEKEDGHVKFGQAILRRYIECLKNGEYPEASRAFDFHAFGVIREEISALREDTDNSEVKKAIDMMQLELATIGTSIKNVLIRLNEESEQRSKISQEQKELLAEIVQLRKELNLLPLDAKPKYELSERDSFLQMRFDQRQTDFTGRETELKLLNIFLNVPRSLSWWQMSGAAGQGKSRLALHLVDSIRSEWDAGFLSADMLANTDWNTIAIIKPTLIVVDYLASEGKTEQFAKAFSCLSGRVKDGDNRLRQPIRFLILDRQGYGKAAEQGEARGLGWYDQVSDKYQVAIRSVEHEFGLHDPETNEIVSTSLELEDLEPSQMVTIANSWRAHLGQNREDQENFAPLNESQTEKMLNMMKGDQHLSDPEHYPRRAWRPLFAMMIGQFITQFDEDGGFDKETIVNILERTLKAEEKEYWPRENKKQIEYAESVWNLACLATIITQYDHHEAQQRFPNIEHDPDFKPHSFFGPFNEPQFEAVNTVLGYRVKPTIDQSGISPLLGREPDLLGEYMVLRELQNQWMFDRTKAEQRMARLSASAFSISPDSFIEFLIRISQDFGDLDITKALFSLPIRINDTSIEAVIDLNTAAYYGFTGIVQTLLSLGADKETMHSSGASPIFLAAQNGHTKIVTDLIEAGADVNKEDKKSGIFPILQAAQNGHDTIVSNLIEAGADVNMVNEKYGIFPILLAAQNGHTKIVTDLIEAGADVNKVNKFGAFPILMAAQNGHDTIVSNLIEAGADVNKENEKSGIIPILQAAQNGHDTIVSNLIEAGADVNKENEKSGLFPILQAAQNGHDTIVSNLIEAGADVNMVNEKHRTFPILMAAQNGHDTIVSNLIEAGADVNMVDEKYGIFPILFAAKNGHDTIVSKLVKAGADVNKVHKDTGLSPADMAVASEDEATIEVVAKELGISIDTLIENATKRLNAYMDKVQNIPE